MKSNDEPLGMLLQEWRVTAPLPPRFGEQVWKRIERAETPGISIAEAARAWFAAVVARPAVAFAYVTVLLMIGLTLGALQANQKTVQWEQELAARYVQSIDPYQKDR